MVDDWEWSDIAGQMAVSFLYFGMIGKAEPLLFAFALSLEFVDVALHKVAAGLFDEFMGVGGSGRPQFRRFCPGRFDD